MKIKPCPKCKTSDHLAVYKYEHGGQHVECDECYYLGPCSGNRRDAIKMHNARQVTQQEGSAGE